MMKYTNLPHLIETRTDPRKLRLFSVACARRVQYLITNPLSTAAIDIAERFADGKISLKNLIDTRVAAYHVIPYYSRIIEQAYLSAYYTAETISAASAAYFAAYHAHKAAYKREDDEEYQLKIFHDIFEPVYNIPKTPLIVNLAQNMYESNDFTDIPILHDALLDASAPETVLNHLKNPIHIKGCSIIDNILNK